MGSIEIYWTQTAVHQLEIFFHSLKENNQEKKLDRLTSKIRSRINSLKDFPNFGIKTNFLNYRLVSLGQYCLVYKSEHHRIYITAFGNKQQDPEQFLQMLQKK